MLSYCGLECSTCPIHLATLETEPVRQYSMRVAIANRCTEVYGMPMNPEDITDCDGCTLLSGRLFSGCAKCEIRRCAGARNLLTCAYCPDYPCAALRARFTSDPGARVQLEKMRSSQ